MKSMAVLKRMGSLILDVIEIYIPTLTFAIMFVVFIVQVFYRYFLNNPLTWPPEIISLTFIWTTVLGACYAQRLGDHVAFTIVYDRLSAKGQLFFRLIGNTFVASAFIIALQPTYEYVTFMSFKKSTVLKIPYSVIFFPFLIFLILLIGRLLYAIFTDLNILFGRGELVRDDGLPEIDLADYGIEQREQTS